MPNAGKSTLFSALSSLEVKISPRPFTTIDPNRAIIELPDSRTDLLSLKEKIQNIRRARLEFIDIAGLIEGAHKGAGLGNEFLSYLQEADLILLLIKNFVLEGVPPDPQKELKVVLSEILLRDIKILERRKAEKRQEKELINSYLEELKSIIDKDPEKILEIQKDSESLRIAKSLSLISYLPKLVVYNGFYTKTEYFSLDAKLELEIKRLTSTEKQALGLESRLENLLWECYHKLDLISFFTIAKKKEIRSNLVIKGTSIKEGANLIHSDFSQRLKGAESLSWKEYLEVENWEDAKKKGKIRLVSGNKIIEEGDILEFKI